MAKALGLNEEQNAFLQAVNWTLDLFDHRVNVLDMDFEQGTIALRGPDNEVVNDCREIIHKVVTSYYKKAAERRLY